MHLYNYILITLQTYVWAFLKYIENDKSVVPWFITGMPYIRHMPKISAVAGKAFTLKCPIAGYPIESVFIEKGIICKKNYCSIFWKKLVF